MTGVQTCALPICHPSTEDAAAVVARLQEALGTDEITFHPGVQYRHIVVAPADWADAECVPPHDLSDKPAVFPTGSAAPRLQGVMDASRDVLAAAKADGSPVTATQVWLWGQGPQPVMTSFREAFGVSAGLVTAVDLVRGLGVLTEMDIRCV